MPIEIDPVFVTSPRGLALSSEASAALRGMIAFAIPRHSELQIEASAAQIAEWVGPESGLGRVPILRGVKELLAAGLISRKPGAPAQGRFVISAVAVRRT